ncbi:hypothetical protein EDD86DRAFT_245639 [Gorgonomyces haynaldii]|nr:hypothetical protein EDD86DRAFT_245639 [Gorgonomyces haynaldii]
MLHIQSQIPPYQLDKWRKTIVFQSQKYNGSHKNTNYLAIGCGSRTRNFYIAEFNATNKLELQDDEEPPEDALKVVSSFNFPSPCYSVASMGDKLLTAGQDGTAQLYRIEKDDIKNGKGLDHINEIVFNAQSLKDMVISPPGTLVQSMRIQHVAFEPACGLDGDMNQARRVIGLQQNTVYHYDLPSSQVLGRESIGKDRLVSASFSSHAPFGSLLALAGMDGRVSVLDTRQLGNSSSVWSVEKSHEGMVNCVQFNPFVPYWIATGGSDGVVKIWDIRFLNGHVGRIDGHYASIQSLAWSNTHAEVISTVSGDRTWKSWALDPSIMTSKKPARDFVIGFPGSEFDEQAGFSEKSLCVAGRVIGDNTQYKAPPVGIVASQSHGDTFFTLDAIGHLSSHTIRHEVFRMTVKHKYDDPTTRDVETALFCRQLNFAYESMVMLDRAPRSQGVYVAPNEKELIEQCTFVPPIDPNQWSVSSQPGEPKKMIQQFKSDLEQFTTLLPPGYGLNKHWTGAIHSWSQLQYDLVVLRFKLVTALQQGNWQFVIENEKSILKGMDVDPEFMDAGTVTLMVEQLIVKSFMKASTIGLKVSQLLSDVQKFEFGSLSSFLPLLIFPTVFDQAEWLPTREKLRQTADERQNLVEKYMKRSKETQETKTRGRSSTTTGNKNQGRRRVALQMEAPESKPVTESDPRIKQLMPYVSDSKQILPMVSLELKLMKLIETPPNELEEEIVKVMQSVLSDSISKRAGSNGPTLIPYENTISSWANVLYLETLLNTKRYDEFFGVGCNLVYRFPGGDFAQLILRSLEKNGLTTTKDFLDGIYQSVNAAIGGQPSIKPVIQASVSLKNALVVLIKVTAHLMDAYETNKEKEAIDCFGRILTTLTGIMTQHSGILWKLFEQLDKLTKGTPIEIAHTVHDAVRDAARTLPLTGNKQRPVGQDKMQSGHAIHEETFSLIDKLYRGYIKTQDQ